MTSTALTDLQYVIDGWSDLADMLTTRHGDTWPPAMGISKLLAEHDDPIQARAAERADSRYSLGASPAPLRIDIVDTMRSIEGALVYCADVLAAEIQRPVMAKAPAHWLPEDKALRDKLVAEDAADKRRWRYPGHRTAVMAAVWLCARIEAAPGPFLRLSSVQIGRVEAVAASAARHMARALDAISSVELLDHDCPHCTAPLAMRSGDGALPEVSCYGCRQVWTLDMPAAA